MTRPLVVGTVPYLNAWPLVYGLEARPDVRLRSEPPRALAALLRQGEVDAALGPSIDYFRLAAERGERLRGHGTAAFVALPVAAIGSRGPVGSVRLFGYGDPKALRRVRLDPDSRTSNVLARLLIRRILGQAPHYAHPAEEKPGGPRGAPDRASRPARPPDAEVAIGDRALAPPPAAVTWTLDLGEAWNNLIHLPFVYAFWTARADADLARLSAVLTEARDAGLAAVDELAKRASERLGLAADHARRYLTEQIHYAFGPRERKGLRVFYEMAVEEGMAPPGARLRMAEA